MDVKKGCNFPEKLGNRHVLNKIREHLPAVATASIRPMRTLHVSHDANKHIRCRSRSHAIALIKLLDSEKDESEHFLMRTATAISRLVKSLLIFVALYPRNPELAPSKQDLHIEVADRLTSDRP